MCIKSPRDKGRSAHTDIHDDHSSVQRSADNVAGNSGAAASEGILHGMLWEMLARE